ncbi:hypothetical protein JAO78_005265 [Alishewanella sp. 16-MA]|uniref:Uncharacterized protein n=1 Tax=Alishewanella maricola TaxID=2795740 RepID=A0ABS8C1L4_9ALTE|nr:hypothetical protein [Alishewanella maricola]MCB5226221.1 hypothetical protein [Alishewanella maricola]
MSNEQQNQTNEQKPASCLDWELTQALIHLNNAKGLTDSRRAHLLLSAAQIVKGVRES